MAREYRQSSSASPAALLENLMDRMQQGEFLGQDDGDIWRVEHLTTHFQLSENQVLKAADDLGAIVVAGVILPKLGN